MQVGSKKNRDLSKGVIKIRIVYSKLECLSTSKLFCQAAASVSWLFFGPPGTVSAAQSWTLDDVGRGLT